MNEAEDRPQVALRQLSAARSEITEYWNVRWEVENLGDQPIEILAARLPHGQFKSEEMRFEPPLNLSAHGIERFQTSVRCTEPPGLVTENAFIIFHAVGSGQSWRIFARICVHVDSAGTPVTTTESITTQEVGFSGVSS